MLKFKLIDKTTKEASTNEVERIYAGFKERISSFCSRNSLEFSSSLVLNPEIGNCTNLIRLKDSLYCYVSDDVRTQLSDTQYSDVINKLRFFTFEKNGINNILFILGDYNPCNSHVVTGRKTESIEISALYQPQSTRDLFSSYVSVQKVKASKSLVCIFGDSYSGKTTCAISILSALGLKFSIVDNSTLFTLKEGNIQKLFNNSNSKALILENSDYLFSDYKGNVPSIDLITIRERILTAWQESEMVLILTLSSTDYIPKSFISRFSLIVGLEKPSIEIRRTILNEKIHDSAVVEYVAQQLSLCSLGSFIDIVDDLAVLQNKSFLNQDIAQCHLSYISASQTNLQKNVDGEYRLEVPNVSLDNDVVLLDSSKEKLKMALSAIVHKEYLMETLGWKEIDPNARSIINFFGPPGTGKTLTAKSVASYMTKQTGIQYELMSLNYSEIESKYVGDAPKKLEKAFNYARGRNVIMFFDEADSFLGKRITNVEHGADQAINSLRSTMLIQLEKFTGIVIFATNLTCNYDKAFKTRFLVEIEFKLPDKMTLAAIIKANLPKKLLSNRGLWEDNPLNDSDFKLLGEKAEGLSGRDIRNINERVLIKNIEKKLSVQSFLLEIELYKEEQKAVQESSQIRTTPQAPQPLPQDVEKALQNAQPVVNEDCHKVKEKLLKQKE